MKDLLRRLIVWIFIKKTGLTIKELQAAFFLNHFITRSNLRSYWMILRSNYHDPA